MPHLRSELRNTSDPRRALNNFQRFLASSFSVSLIRQFSSQKVLLDIALALFSQSQYIADILVRSPELFQWLVASGALKTTKTPEAFLTEARKSIEPFDRTEKKIDALKRYHRREMLRIGAREILHEAHIMTITVELSALADSIIETVLFLGEEEMKRSTELKPESPLAVIGLGKLGGNELNFSSDIDLMFVFSQDKEFPGNNSRVRSMFEYCSRLSEFVVRKLSEHTDEGHFYRVDVRLRPDGGGGPLALSVQAYRSYYETRGELWERQMLLKARTVAGNKVVGDAWQKNLEPFVYPKTHLVSPLREISEMKKKIESRISGDANIKLGSGGIRDIEFVVQALQLLNGGRLRNVRARPTMKAIDQLADEGILGSGEKKNLGEAYEFLRTVEHRLQLLHGQQTHSLPASPDEAHKLSKSLGFSRSEDFEKLLDARRKKVRAIFNSVFQEGLDEFSRGASSDKKTHPFEKTLKFIDRGESHKSLANLLKETLAFQSSRVQKMVTKALGKFGAEDWGLRNLSWLVSQSSVQKSLPQVVEKNKLIDLLVLVASRSDRMVQTLGRESLLFESLLARPEDVLGKKTSWEFFLDSDPLRFRVFNEFRICLRFLLGLTSIEETTGELSSLADTVVNHALEKSVSLEGVCIVALGKYGGRELSVGSDLDLICVYEGTTPPEKMEQSLKNFLGYFMESGKRIYQVDFRLRPEGKNAPLAAELGYYEVYLSQRASLWEKQSLLKARIVGGDHSVGKKLQAVIEENIWRKSSPGWAREIIQMRKTMERERAKGAAMQELKLGRGGMVDIEFLVQAIQLKLGLNNESLRSPNTFEVLRSIRKKAFMNASLAGKLLSNYSYLRALEMLIRLNSWSKAVVIPQEKILLKALSGAMGERSIDGLQKKLAGIRKENRKLFLKTLSSSGK
ncbi:MAG TPA: hypothetical protein VI704_04920 [Bacteroidota bacterium]|nr:hypothetical protein [Bacteroidota bacterium]